MIKAAMSSYTVGIGDVKNPNGESSDSAPCQPISFSQFFFGGEAPRARTKAAFMIRRSK